MHHFQLLSSYFKPFKNRSILSISFTLNTPKNRDNTSNALQSIRSKTSLLKVQINISIRSSVLTL